MATNPQVFDFDIGDVTGKKGDTGNGIKSIQLLSTSGLVKTYRITMTDDTTFDFSVSDGEDGDDGNGISGASFDAETNELTITFDNGTSFTTPSLKGDPGNPGDDGYSPAVTIETITGGHRVTITDETHPTGQSFDVMDGQGGGGGTSDYTDLTNKPKINGHTLDGNQSAADLGLGTYSKPASGIPKTDLASDVKASLGKADTALQTAPVQSVNGKTGAVVLSAADVGAKPASYTAPVSSVNGKTGAVSLDSGNIGFDSAQTYQAGTVGAELQNQTRQLSDVEENQIPELKNAISQKQEAPSTAGTPGQVLSLDSQLNPVWADQTGGGGGGGGMNIVNLSGTQITQVGADNTFYVCGELTELTFTAPAVGITMIRFTSGTTPTVLTVNGVTSWMFDNDPTTASLEANKTYDINVLNGVGVVGWA